MLKDLNQSRASLRNQMLIMRPILSLFSTAGISLLCILYDISFIPVLYIGGAITLGFLIFYIRDLVVKKDASNVIENQEVYVSSNKYQGSFKITKEKILLEVNGRTNQELPYIGSQLTFVGDHIIRFVHPAYANSLEVMAMIFDENDLKNIEKLFNNPQL